MGRGLACIGTVPAELRRASAIGQAVIGDRKYNPAEALNIYTQAVSDQKRAANSKVVEMVLSGAKRGPISRVSSDGSETGVSCDVQQLQQTASSD